jgi:hypothetical protein
VQPTDVDVVIPSVETGPGGTYNTQYTYHVDGSPDSVAWSATADLPMEGLHYGYDPITSCAVTLASTKSRRFSTTRWAGRGERDGKLYGVFEVVRARSPRVRGDCHVLTLTAPVSSWLV